MTAEDPVLQITLLLATVLVVQLTLERLHIPAVVGLLVAGMLAGPGGAGLLPAEPVVALFGAIGLVYIMFLAGVEIDLDAARARTRETVTFGLLAFGCSLAPALVIGFAAGYGWQGALLLGAALSSHTLVAYPILERLRILHTRPMTAAIGGTLLTDTLALVLLVVTIQQTGGTGAWEGMLPLVLLVVLVVVALWMVPHLAQAFLVRVPSRPSEKALFVLVVLLLLAAAADGVGTEDILGAFLAGICLNRALRTHPDLHAHVQFVGRMLFVPIFFVDTGMRLDLEVFTGRTEVWGLAAAMLGAILFGKGAAAWLAGARFGYAAAARVTMGALALPQAAATLAVTTTARQAGALDERATEAVIVVIFVTCLAGPLLVRAAGSRMRAADAT